MAVQYTTVEVWVCVDSDGDYRVSCDEDGAVTAYNEDVGGTGGRRLVKVTVTVPLPTVIELAGEVTVDESGTELKAS